MILEVRNTCNLCYIEHQIFKKEKKIAARAQTSQKSLDEKQEGALAFVSIKHCFSPGSISKDPTEC